ncbi:manganese catalase family protein [Rubrobacter indicoceani]|uniref:manganese catalase family protein n=1 Tax=Rubrobacter indicoceani TaxID=2051957 RepID=UPI000E5B4372|nr:manganese catalase family protein [Rubrobacter indicoceani]
MFRHVKQYQYHAKPEKADPIFAKQMQELIGGQWGEMSVMIGYLFQGWNCRGPAKYKDMLMDTATEEIGHVEMLATMVARLLETSPVEAEEAANGASDGGIVASVLGGGDTQSAIINAAMNPQHAVVSGMGATPRDSMGNPWNTGYIVASGNLLADMRFNVTAESQGRLQVARLYQLTEDPGVRDMFSFLLARDTMHQNQWLAAIEELEADGLEDTPVPSNFPQEREMSGVAYQFMNFSEGEESAEGRWANGPSKDGKGKFEYVASPEALAPEFGELSEVDPRLYGTPKQPKSPASS